MLSAVQQILEDHRWSGFYRRCKCGRKFSTTLLHTLHVVAILGNYTNEENTE